MNKENLHIILQYSLLCARQNEDRWDWEIGPIHLIKYAYLADLAYAKKHQGATFTGVDWSFHNFGPWSVAVHQEIPLALNAIGALMQEFPSDYGDEDYYRWSYPDDDSDSLFEKIGDMVPPSVEFYLRKMVRKFGKDTPDLLDYVYNTSPMRSAAPGEALDFSEFGEEKVEIVKETFEPALSLLSIKKKKKLKARLEEIRAAKRDKGCVAKEKRLVPSQMEPIDETVWQKGIDWLDSLAGPSLPQGRHEVEFDDSVWKSSVRRMEKY